MAAAGRDIEERAFRFACDVVRFCDARHHEAAVLRRLLMQLADSATSIGSNLEEAAAGQSRADFIAKACIARKEAREARYWLRVICACYEPLRAEAIPLLTEAHQIYRVVAAIVKAARANRERERQTPRRPQSRTCANEPAERP